MINPQINVGVDEITLVLQVNKDYLHDDFDIDQDWGLIAKVALNRFVQKSQIEELFGEEFPIETCPKGYTHGFKYGNHSFYFAMAYHDMMPQMGIICKFSAQSWHSYRNLYEVHFNNKINIHNFMQNASDLMYSIRLSRIDFYVDYINYDITVDDLYSSLTRDPQSLVLKDQNGRSNYTELTALERNLSVSTFYVGSKRGNSNSMLRVYDKKLEQTERFGFRLDEALKYRSWVRFEVVFRNIYAHQLSEILLKDIDNDDKLQSLIAGKILEKFTLHNFNNGEIHYLSGDLLKIKENEYQALKSASTKDNDLNRSINYLTTTSGLNTTVYKIEKLWGENEVPRFFEYLQDSYKKTYEPNDNVHTWLRKHQSEMKQYSFREYLKKL